MNLHVEFLRLGKHGDCGRRCMDASLGFCGRDTLHAVNATLVFHHAVYILTRERENYFLITSGGTFGE